MFIPSSSSCIFQDVKNRATTDYVVSELTEILKSVHAPIDSALLDSVVPEFDSSK